MEVNGHSLIFWDFSHLIS